MTTRYELIRILALDALAVDYEEPGHVAKQVAYIAVLPGGRDTEPGAEYDGDVQCQQSAGGVSYDANGNPTNGGYNLYTVENKLDVGNSGSYPYPQSGYGYDPWGKRVMKFTNPDPFDYEGQNNPVWEFYFYTITGQRLVTMDCTPTSGTLPNCTVAGENVYFGKKLLVSNGVYVATDRLGTVRANTQGESFAYYPYGEERTNTVNGRDKFATYFRDKVGQDYADQRYYNSGSGSFLTADPGGMTTAHLKAQTSWNRYLYTGGDPVNHIDPSGLDYILVSSGWCSAPEEGEYYTCDQYQWNGVIGQATATSSSAPSGGGATWARALSAIQVAQAVAVADLAPGQISGDCQHDISALGQTGATVGGVQGINDETIAGAVADINPQNGLAASATASTLNDPSINAVANVANGPISNLFNSGSTMAEAQLGGNTVYFRPSWLTGNTSFYDAALLMHEALHNLGLNDSQVESALGLGAASATERPIV